MTIEMITTICFIGIMLTIIASFGFIINQMVDGLRDMRRARYIEQQIRSEW